MAHHNQGKGGRNYNEPRPPQKKNWKSEFQSVWIKGKLNKAAIEFADEFGKDFSKRLTTSQFRNVYGELKRIQMKGLQDEYTSFLLIKPKLAYAAKRNKMPAPFLAVFNKAYDAVETETHFQNFMDFMEAVLAYHKAYDGK